MKTDAMESFFDGNGKTSRMDCTGVDKKRNAGMGFVSKQTESGGRKPFENALAEVTAENAAAHRSACTAQPDTRSVHKKVDERSAKAVQSNDERSGKEYLPEELLQLLTGSLVGGEEMVEQSQDVPVLLPDDVAESAETVVREALAVLSETLGISIFSKLEDLSLKEISGDTQRQFAEIVFTLKKMLQAFAVSREQGMPIELPSGTVEGEGIDALSNVLQVSAFKIEIACTMLGIAEPVQKQVAVQMEQFQASGIVQATDPSTLAMAAQHTERLFKGMFTGEQSTSEISTLVQQVKQLIAENGGEASISVESAGKGASASGELQQFDAAVYRALLKIDKLAKVEQQNGSAAIGDEKSAAAKFGQPVLPVARELSAAKSDDNAEAGTVLSLQSGTQQNGAVGSQMRMAGTLMRMSDETVMEQITAKLQTVLRSGMNEVRIQLRPESLGEVTMRIRMEGDVVLAKIEVQNQQVKEIMERNLPMLKDALAQQNISAGSFEVQVNNGTGRHLGNMPHTPWNEEETAGQGHGGEQREDDHETAGEQGRHPQHETGRRFGGNSVEYFA